MDHNYFKGINEMTKLHDLSEVPQFEYAIAKPKAKIEPVALTAEEIAKAKGADLLEILLAN